MSVENSGNKMQMFPTSTPWRNANICMPACISQESKGEGSGKDSGGGDGYWANPVMAGPDKERLYEKLHLDGL